MTINNKVYINYFDSVSYAGNDSLELFQSVCEQKDTILLIQVIKKEKVVAIGKVSKMKICKIFY